MSNDKALQRLNRTSWIFSASGAAIEKFTPLELILLPKGHDLPLEISYEDFVPFLLGGIRHKINSSLG